jgi:hypothetical protein
VRRGLVQVALRQLRDVVDEVGLDAERGRERQHGRELGFVERAVDERHHGCEPHRIGGETGHRRERLELLRLGRRQAREVGRQREFEDVARRRDDAGAVGVSERGSRLGDRAHCLEYRVCFGGSCGDMHGDGSGRCLMVPRMSPRPAP